LFSIFSLFEYLYWSFKEKNRGGPIPISYTLIRAISHKEYIAYCCSLVFCFLIGLDTSTKKLYVYQYECVPQIVNGFLTSYWVWIWILRLWLSLVKFFLGHKFLINNIENRKCIIGLEIWLSRYDYLFWNFSTELILFINY
jgi:hypothetical protein